MRPFRFAEGVATISSSCSSRWALVHGTYIKCSLNQDWDVGHAAVTQGSNMIFDQYSRLMLQIGIKTTLQNDMWHLFILFPIYGNLLRYAMTHLCLNHVLENMTIHIFEDPDLFGRCLCPVHSQPGCSWLSVLWPSPCIQLRFLMLLIQATLLAPIMHLPSRRSRTKDDDVAVY